jgi:hypothetical protein
MDCQEMIMYGLLFLAAVYVLRDMFDLKFKIPLLEGQDVQPPAPGAADPGAADPGAVAPAPGAADPMGSVVPVALEEEPVEPASTIAEVASNLAPTPLPTEQLPSGKVESRGPVASEANNNETFLPVEGIRSAPSSCYPQNTLTPKDLLPQGKEEEIEQWDENNPAQEGILKGVNFLDAGFHVGVNTVGQSLRNANLNLRAEPPNPRVQVSPWMNTTIDEDLTRRALGTEGVCNQAPPEYGLVQ